MLDKICVSLFAIFFIYISCIEIKKSRKESDRESIVYFKQIYYTEQDTTGLVTGFNEMFTTGLAILRIYTQQVVEHTASYVC